MIDVAKFEGEFKVKGYAWVQVEAADGDEAYELMLMKYEDHIDQVDDVEFMGMQCLDD